MTIDFERLADKFKPGEIEWRVGSKSKDERRASLLAYVTARAVMERLDAVCGVAGWRDTYRPCVGGKETGFICTLEILVDGQWIGKEDAADATDIESIKGGVSGALKRAAVKWGIGRYLYDLDASWVEVKPDWPPRGTDAIAVKLDKGMGHCFPPPLPAWALPAEPIAKARTVKPTEPKPTAEPKALPTEPDGTKLDPGARLDRDHHHPSWEDDRTKFCGALGRMNMDYDVVSKVCEGLGKPRPSAMLPDQRHNLLGWLRGAAGRTAYAAAKQAAA